jgi:hypothetical protein
MRRARPAVPLEHLLHSRPVLGIRRSTVDHFCRIGGEGPGGLLSAYGPSRPLKANDQSSLWPSRSSPWHPAEPFWWPLRVGRARHVDRELGAAALRSSVSGYTQPINLRSPRGCRS